MGMGREGSNTKGNEKTSGGDGNGDHFDCGMGQ
jgi:hypothetical protein